MIEMLAAEDSNVPDASALTAAIALNELFSKAAWRGNQATVEAYAHLIREHVENLNRLIASRRELLLPYSRKCLNWPVRASMQKPFRDNADDIISKLQVGEETIADDSSARFDPNGKFGKIAFEVYQRIEQARGAYWFVPPRPGWEREAPKLPAFPRHTRRPTPAEAKSRHQWLGIVEQVLEDDFRDPEKASSYLSLLTAPSYKRNRSSKAACFDKIRNEFETLWGSRRQPNK